MTSVQKTRRVTAEEARDYAIKAREYLEHYSERPVFRIGLRFAGPDPRVALREQAALSKAEQAQLVRRLDRLHRASRHGPWTRATLAAIDRRPYRVARHGLPSLARVRALRGGGPS